MTAHTTIHNPREADHPIHAQFTSRFSPRGFTPKALTEEEVLAVLEAARWAPSASNNQPWRFAYGLRGDAAFGKIADSLVPFNRSWAEKAAALIVVASRTTIEKDGADVPVPTHAFDAGAAWGYLALQAHHAGLIAHAMAGFDPKTLAENLKLPEGYVLHAVVAVGEHGNIENLPEVLQAREVPSNRFPLDKVAAHGKFV
ncbi:MAG: nitroreductase family protein [Cypionkella sp.]|uniref:nitroreductase family protein n=1 Tax=Cypionkella sp. TaxID=2811411 RepID=UPI002ABBAB16|nr:nitroreductase family protein [Cypionkella sp.]MDZ4312483.1 nitroreductase family protein [Cypionkella sp.]